MYMCVYTYIYRGRDPAVLPANTVMVGKQGVPDKDARGIHITIRIKACYHWALDARTRLKRRRPEQLLSAAAPLMSVRLNVQSGPVVIHHRQRRLFKNIARVYRRDFSLARCSATAFPTGRSSLYRVCFYIIYTQVYYKLLYSNTLFFSPQIATIMFFMVF